MSDSFRSGDVVVVTTPHDIDLFFRVGDVCHLTSLDSYGDWWAKNESHALSEHDGYLGTSDEDWCIGKSNRFVLREISANG